LAGGVVGGRKVSGQLGSCRSEQLAAVGGLLVLLGGEVLASLPPLELGGLLVTGDVKHQVVDLVAPGFDRLSWIGRRGPLSVDVVAKLIHGRLQTLACGRRALASYRLASRLGAGRGFARVSSIASDDMNWGDRCAAPIRS
jgi:hypothetical protein